MHESNRIEFKNAYSKELDLEREVVAFLNYREGGYIYIGINKEGKVIGISDDIDDVCLKIKDRIKDNILPSALGLFDVTIESIEDKEVIKITVASGSEKPYYIKKYGMSEKGSLIRSGTAVQPMSQRMIDDLYASRTSLQSTKVAIE